MQEGISSTFSKKPEYIYAIAHTLALEVITYEAMTP
jgi:hypothetical protein